MTAHGCAAFCTIMSSFIMFMHCVIYQKHLSTMPIYNITKFIALIWFSAPHNQNIRFAYHICIYQQNIKTQMLCISENIEFEYGMIGPHEQHWEFQVTVYKTWYIDLYSWLHLNNDNFTTKTWNESINNNILRV